MISEHKSHELLHVISCIVNVHLAFFAFFICVLTVFFSYLTNLLHNEIPSQIVKYDWYFVSQFKIQVAFLVC